MSFALISSSKQSKAPVMAAHRKQPIRRPSDRSRPAVLGGQASGAWIGTSGTAPVIQAKLEVGEPNDKFEREADQVADQVLSMPQQFGAADSRPVGNATQSIQRMCSECEEEDQKVRRMPSSAPAPPRISTLTGPLSPRVSLLPATDGGDATVTPSLDQAIRGASATGTPLPATTRSFLEPRFGRDLAGVRIHTDRTSGELAQSLQSRAFTVGSDIFFAPGEFNTRSSSGLRVLSHELTHTVQQGAVPAAGLSQATGPHVTPGASGAIQREVNPKRIENKETVLAKTKRIADSVTTKGDQDRPAVSNLDRLAKLGIGFNPGADKSEANNAFVYTCKCGWIDMGHFFISAAVAYLTAYLQSKMGLKIEGVPRTFADLLAMGVDKIKPFLRPLLTTVSTGDQGEKILADLDALLASEDPRDISLAFGYGMEFGQQVLKLIADPMEKPPPAIEGSQRSAFTMEDLPSDCYGAALGQAVWRKVSRAKLDASPVHGMLEQFFSDCEATYPQGQTRCEMMAETTPGSCRMEGNKEVWPEDGGEPARYISTKPNLLGSAQPLCGNAEAKPCESGTSSGLELPEATVDVSAQQQSVTLTLPGNIKLYQPQERGEFGGGFRIPGRPEQIAERAPVMLRGLTLGVDAGGDVTAYTTVGGMPFLGDTSVLTQLDLTTGRVAARAAGPILEAEGSAELHIDYAGLFKELLELSSPEAQRFKEILESKDFKALLKKFITRQIGPDELYTEAKTLLKNGFPEGFKKAGMILLERLVTQLKDELLAIYTGVKGRATVTAFGVPISYLTVAKGTGRKSPLWGTESGLLTSELFNERAAAGAKVWLFADYILQGHATAGVDLLTRKGYAEIFAETKYFGGVKLNAKLHYEINPEGDQLIFLTIGGQHHIWDSKPRGTK
jgi:hypothetical protein